MDLQILRNNLNTLIFLAYFFSLLSTILASLFPKSKSFYAWRNKDKNWKVIILPLN